MIWKAQIAGASAATALLALSLGALSRFVPSETALGPLARIIDAFSPWLLGIAIAFSLLAVILGMRRVAGAMCVVSIGATVQLYAEHHRLSLPTVPDRTPDMSVLFFNAFAGNETPSDQIVGAALSLAPDVIVFAESEVVYPSLEQLQAQYAFVSPCSAESCELLIATKRQPKRFWKLQLTPLWDARYAVAELETDGGKSFFLVANHLAKPWLSGIAETELHKLAAQYSWLPGPAVVVGDFNAAPWSRPLQQLLTWTGMAGLRVPLATWPAKAAGFGVPIDQVLVHDGPRVVRIRAFGEGLGSNHRGFLAEIALPE